MSTDVGPTAADADARLLLPPEAFVRAWEVVESVQFGTDDRLLDAIAEAQTEPTESWIAMTLMLSCAMADAAEARGWDEQTYRTAMLGWFAGRYLASELLED